MKFLILLLSFSLQAAIVPQEWISEETINKSEFDSVKFEKYFDQIIGLQEEVFLSDDSEKLLNDWKVSGHKTDLAISKSGLLGLSALSGTSTIELTWVKNKEKSLEQNEALELSTSDDVSQILKRVNEASVLILERIEDSDKRQKIKNHWMESVVSIHEALQGVEVDEQSSFIPTKFRIDLTASYSAPLLGLQKLSGDARLRLEWKIVKNNDKARRAQKVIEGLVQDINKAAEKIENAEFKGYKLDQMAFAIGLNKKNLFALTKVKGGLTGSMFFKKVKVQKGVSEDKEITSNYFSEEENKGIFSKDKFQKGIQQGIKIGQWVDKKLSARQTKVSVGKYKINFALAYSGFLGLSTVGSSGEFELYFTK